MRKSNVFRLALPLLVILALPVSPASAAAPPTNLMTGSGRWVGYYVPGVPSSMTDLLTLESQVGTKAAVVNFFIGDGQSFPLAKCQNAVNHGSVPMVTLNFDSLAGKSVSTLTNGSKDAYLADFAEDAKSFGGQVWLRPFNEMNGNWMAWSGTINGNTPAMVVAAWKHVRDVFAAHGATNVKFVWCMNADSVPNTSANAIRNYWPGDAYVDYVAMDGYNWGATSTSSWQTFSQVFGSAYSQITALTSKPMLIAETGSCEQGGSKPAWIADLFKVVPSTYPRIRGVCWFDQNKERDWRVDSSAGSLAAFKTALATWAPPAPAPPPTTTPTPDKRIKRHLGGTRYATSVAISQATFSTAGTVIVATGLDYADALAAAPVAGALKAPVLLVPKTCVTPEVLGEIARLHATKAIIVGGTAAVSDEVRDVLAGEGLAVERISGPERYATAAALARRAVALTGHGPDVVLVVRGDYFPDALGVSSAASSKGIPVLLVKPSSIPPATLQALDDLAPQRVVLLGGTAAVSSVVEDDLRAGCPAGAVRVAGIDRYATSAAFATYSVQQGWTSPERVGVASGSCFADALGGGPAVGGQGGTLLLTQCASLPAGARAFLEANSAGVVGIDVYGGETAVQTAVVTDLASTLPPQ